MADLESYLKLDNARDPMEQGMANRLGNWIKEQIKIGSSSRDAVDNISDPAAIFNKLDSLYAPKENYTRRNKLIDFERLLWDWNGAQPLADHLTKYTKLKNELIALDVAAAKDNEYLAARLLASVAHVPRYETVRKELLSLGMDDFTDERVQRELIRHHDFLERDVDKLDNNVGPAAFYGKGRKQFGKQSDGRGGNRRTCFTCGSTDHLRADCLKEPRRNQHANAHHATVFSFGANDTTNYNPSKSPQHYQPHIWIPDSGATHSMAPWRKLFSEYRPMKGTVTLGNGHHLQAVGIGTVWRATNGKDGIWRRRKLTNVWHVPELGANLLSIHSIASNGHKIVFDGNKMELIE